jgi:hypothetical protein
MVSSHDGRSGSSLVAPGLVAVAAVSWVLLLLASPFLVARFAPSDATFRVAAAVYLAGAAVCHQRPERSFHAWGAQLPVCGRCFGLYASAAIGALGVVCARLRRAGVRGRPGLPPGRFERTLLIAAAVPTGLSVALEAAGVWAQNPGFRAAAAAPLGLAAGCFVACHVEELRAFWSRL